MARYIDADTIEKYVKRDEHKTPDERWRPESEFCAIIDSIQTEDVAPVVHGRWVLDVKRVQVHGSDYLHERITIVCSECGRKEYFGIRHISDEPFELDKNMFPYCHCGAKMDLE